MKRKRWLALFVENDVGVLAEISSLFAGKAYNLDSLTVGVTADKTISRMTICLTSDDILFEQIKKQLNRNVNVIKVIDLTDSFVAERELSYLKITDFKPENLYPLFEVVKQFELQILEIKSGEILLQSVNSFERTDELINKLADGKYAVEVVRSGSVAI